MALISDPTIVPNRIDQCWTMRESRPPTPLEKLGRERNFLRAHYDNLLRLRQIVKFRERETAASSKSTVPAKPGDTFRN